MIPDDAVAGGIHIPLADLRCPACGWVATVVVLVVRSRMEDARADFTCRCGERWVRGFDNGAPVDGPG